MGTAVVVISRSYSTNQRQGKHLETDQALDILGMRLMRLQVPKDHTGLRAVRPVEGIHQAARKVSPLVLRLHIGKVDIVFHSNSKAEAAPFPCYG